MNKKNLTIKSPLINKITDNSNLYCRSAKQNFNSHSFLIAKQPVAKIIYPEDHDRRLPAARPRSTQQGIPAAGQPASFGAGL